ncbi:hypothetical protein AVEN_234781-1 [Araneus ventricosus]|uniref:Uncharacterized protein n=1 Tax=Araneus ventricosus TaxID=182803 RepID=A0A4Y2F4F8_ARAVE|nr:hypothetical protein AVEN_234781-1 [Araneus ventricosus]
MRSLMFLCSLWLFAIVLGQMPNSENFKNHYKCMTYMNCISDGPMARKMESCLDLLQPGDLKLVLENIEENYYEFENHTVPGALNEYCNMDGDEQQLHGGLTRCLTIPLSVGWSCLPKDKPPVEQEPLLGRLC